MKKLIALLFCMISSLLSMAQTSTVTLTSTKQYIRGFGGINLPEWVGSDLTTAQRNTAFGNGNGQIGMSVLRIYVSDNRNDWSRALATAQVATTMGLTIFATPWNPPASMCETITRNNRQEKRLKYASYSDYAQHLIDFNNYMKNNGVNLYAMSFANEPDWGFDWTWYSIDEVYNFVTSQAAKLRVNGVKVITAESFSYSKSYYDKILNDPTALANIDIIGCHLYGSDANSANSFFQYPLADQLATGKERWMTEHYTESANDANLWPMAHDVSYEIHRAMVEGQMSVYTWWYIRRNYGPIKEDGTVSKRGYCMSQYSKFIRPGYVRVDATKNPTTDVYVSAYKKGDDVVIVAVNRSTASKTITLSIPGTKVTTWNKYVTSGSKNVAQEANINSSTGSFQITLDAQSTTSFVGIAPVGTPTANITPASALTFCSGGSVVLNASTGTGYTYQWKLNGSNIANATSSSYTANQSGSYTVAVSANSQTATSNAVFVTVNTIPTAPGINTPVLYCQNATAAALTATGTSLKWYTVATGGTSSTTAPIPSTGAVGTTNYYVSQTTNNCEGPRAMIAVTINASPSAPIVNSTIKYCQNSTASQLTATGNSLKWYTTATGGTGSATAPTPSTTTSGTTNFYVSQTINNCEGPRATIAVTVNALPVVTPYSQVDGGAWNQTSSSTVCSGSSIILGPQPTLATGWSWTGPNAYSSTNREITLSALTATQTGSYSATYTDVNGCKASSVYTLTVNALPSAPTSAVTQISYCQNAIATPLSATGTELKWYTQATGGTGSATAPTPLTTATGTTNYYVSQTTNGCEGARALIAVTVNALPSAPGVISSVTYCQNTTATQLSATGTSLKWYTTATGGTATTTAPTPATAAAGTTNFYVSQTTTGCESSRALIAVTVKPLPAAVITAQGNTTICEGNGNVTLNANTGTGFTYQWFNGTNATGTGNASLSLYVSSGSFTVKVTDANGCTSTSSPVLVTVNPTPAAPAVTTAVTYCQNAAATQLSAMGTGLKWYTISTGGTSSATAPTPSTTTAGTTNYYVSQTTNGCESARAAIAVTVNATPSSPTVSSLVTYCQNSTAAPLSATGTGLKWFTVSTGGTASATAPTPSTATTGTTNYYVSQTINGCESSRALIAVSVNSLPTATIITIGNTNFCQGESVSLSASGGSSYVWFKGAAQVGANSTYTATTAGNYTVEVTNTSGCKAISSATTVIVNPLPTASITAGGPTTFIQGGSVVLSANTGTGFTYIWFSGVSQVGTGSIYTATSGGNYTVEVTNAAGCKATSSVTSVTVNGNQAPVVNITFPVNNASFTAPANVTIAATATDADGTVSKVDFYFGNTLLGTDPTSAYNFAMNNLGMGSYTIIAVATDNLGATTTSASITFTVTNPLPVVSITAPSNGSSFVENAIVSITADASDANGTVTKVEFYNGNILLGTDVTSPYSFTWSNVAAGTYDITAKATDNDGGATTSSSVTITVTGNQPSVITITSPTPNTTIVGAITITVNVSDPDGGITLVEFLDGTTVIGTSSTAPYSYTWVDPSAGDHVISVRVTDSNGGVTTSTPLTLTSEATTGIYSTKGINGVLYPNPCNREINIDAEVDLTNASVTVINVLGEEIQLPSTANERSARVDVSHLIEGMYILIIRQDNAILKKKITVIN
jgi:glucuronoarabinoxylan endo-1,4-beta-xylanase